MQDHRPVRRMTLGALCLLASACAAGRDKVAHEPFSPHAMSAPLREAERAEASFIVSCACASIADRERIAADARGHGAVILYVYNAFAGIAVAPPAGADPAALAEKLARIPGVTYVRRGKILRTHAQRRTEQ